MNFLYPAFLYALAALAIPIIIHLFHFRRYKTVYFSNTKLLKEVKEETSTKNKLKHLLILIARLFALAFLVLAFAQPFIPTSEVQVTQGSRAVSIYIDNSFSMGAFGEDVGLLEKAKEKAREIIAGHSAEDRFQIITNDFRGKHQRFLGKEEITAYLDEIMPTAAVRTVSSITARQQLALANSTSETRIAFLISDFQKNTTDEITDTATQYNLLPLEAVERNNFSLDSCWFEAPVQMLNRDNRLFVKITNRGKKEDTKGLTLKINGEIKGLSEVTIPPKDNIIDTLTFSVTKSGWQKGELFISDWPLTFDDTTFLAFEVKENIPVLVINQQEESKFLKALFKDNGIFQLVNNPVGQVDYSGLSNFQLIILNDLLTVSSGLAEELSTAVDNGASLLIFPNENMDKVAYNDFLKKMNVNTYEDLVTARREVGYINTEQEVFSDVYDGVLQNMALPSAAKSFNIAKSSMTNEEVLLRFKDARSFIGKYNFGNGAVFLCASPLDADATDLPVQGGIFAPMVYKMAVIGSKKRPLALTIGRGEWIALDFPVTGAESIPKIREDESIPMQRIVGTTVFVNFDEEGSESGTGNRKAGVYEIYLPGTEHSELVALNYDRKESVLEHYSAEELEDKFPGANVKIIDASSKKLAGLVGEISEGKKLWKLCLILALAFLGVEILLVRIFP